MHPWNNYLNFFVCYITAVILEFYVTVFIVHYRLLVRATACFELVFCVSPCAYFCLRWALTFLNVLSKNVSELRLCQPGDTAK